MNDQPIRDAQAKVMRDLRDVIIANEQVIKNHPLVEEADFDNILWLIDTGLSRNGSYPIDKIGRWIGFVQCALIVRGILDTNREREKTRSIFHTAYLATNQKIPETLNRNSL